MIYIDRNSVSFPEILNSREVNIAKERLKKFYGKPLNSRLQQKYSRPFELEVSKSIKESLRDLFKNKCAYCESPIPEAVGIGDVDHFRPKSNARGLEKDFSKDHYWWLTYEWKNLYYSCPNCNRYKSTWFPVEGARSKPLTSINKIQEEEQALLIDPCLDRPEEHLTYNENGFVNYRTPKGNLTIEILKLNRIELVKQRFESLKQLQRDWELLPKLIRNKNKNQKEIKRIALDWEGLYSQKTQKPYVAIQRQMLAKWLDNHPEIQNYLTQKLYDFEETNWVEKKILYKDPIFFKLSDEVEKFNTENLSIENKGNTLDTINLENLKHVYLERLELSNFKCFTELNLDFDKQITNENEELRTESWLLFLGENGVGKSTLLKAITIALCGESYFDNLGFETKELLQYGKESGYINLYLKGEENPIVVKFDKNTITSSIQQPKANLIGYGSVRLLPKRRKLTSEKYIKGGVKAQNLFDYAVSLIDADKWLLGISEKDFARAAEALKDLILLEDGVLIERDIISNRIYIQKDHWQQSITDLSDGYQSIYALAVDIMASFVRDKISFEIAEGIVLIDEIGTHLHPRWKMEVVSQLKRTFPRIQFIVTTHEPLCLRGLKAGEIVVLRKDAKENITAITDLPDPSELRVDQILTSDFFGLNSTFDIKTEKIFDEYYEILSLEEKERTDVQKDRLISLSLLIPKIKHLGDTLREELVYHVIDELLAKKSKGILNLKNDELKSETINRVKSLWRMVSDNNLIND